MYTDTHRETDTLTPPGIHEGLWSGEGGQEMILKVLLPSLYGKYLLGMFSKIL